MLLRLQQNRRQKRHRLLVSMLKSVVRLLHEPSQVLVPELRQRHLNISGTMNCQAGGPRRPSLPLPAAAAARGVDRTAGEHRHRLVSTIALPRLAGAGYIMYRRRKQGKKMIPLPPLPKWMKDWKWRRGAKVGVAQASTPAKEEHRSQHKAPDQIFWNKRPWKLKFKLPSMGPCLASCKSAAVVVKNAGVQKKKAKVKKNKVVPKRPPV